MAEAWNYANLKKLPDSELERMMLSPHTSSRLMRVLRFVYKSRILNPVVSDAVEGDVCVFVDCEFKQPLETTSVLVPPELLEALR